MTSTKKTRGKSPDYIAPKQCGALSDQTAQHSENYIKGVFIMKKTTKRTTRATTSKTRTTRTNTSGTTANAKAKSTFCIYQAVTDKIISQLEQNVIPWRKTWQGSEPINYVTCKPYRGINLLLLQRGGEYATFKQIKDAGGYVKKGEKSSMIVFWKMLERENADGEKETIPLLRYYNVFHIDQTSLNQSLTPLTPMQTLTP